MTYDALARAEEDAALRAARTRRCGSLCEFNYIVLKGQVKQ